MANNPRQKRVLQQIHEMPRVEMAAQNLPTVVPETSNKPNEFTPIQMLIAKWFAAGWPIWKIAKKLQFHLVPHESDPRKRYLKARKRTRDLISTIKMRDLIYQEAIALLDLESPAIMRGISKKAKAGRVDAARLAFELNGRHAPHTDVQPATINIVLGKLPRPLGRGDDEPSSADEEISDAEFEDIG